LGPARGMRAARPQACRRGNDFPARRLVGRAGAEATELLLLHARSATPKRPATVAIETDERMASIEVSLSRAGKRTQANEHSRYEGARARSHGAATICFSAPASSSRARDAPAERRVDRAYQIHGAVTPRRCRARRWRKASGSLLRGRAVRRIVVVHCTVSEGIARNFVFECMTQPRNDSVVNRARDRHERARSEDHETAAARSFPSAPSSGHPFVRQRGGSR